MPKLEPRFDPASRIYRLLAWHHASQAVELARSLDVCPEVQRLGKWFDNDGIQFSTKCEMMRGVSERDDVHALMRVSPLYMKCGQPVRMFVMSSGWQSGVVLAMKVLETFLPEYDGALLRTRTDTHDTHKLVVPADEPWKFHIIPIEEETDDSVLANK